MKKAFTLIELLVVIAIIAILAAILFPVFAQAKAAAKKTADLSNMKQMATGIQIYLSDSDDTYPNAVMNNNGTNSESFYTTPATRTATSAVGLDMRQSFWGNATFPYIKSYGLYRNSTSDWNLFGIDNPTVNPQNFADSYAMNTYLNNYSSTAINSPSSTIVFFQGMGTGAIQGYTYSYPPIGASGLTAPYRFGRGTGQCPAGLYVYGGQHDAHIFSGGHNLVYADTNAKFTRTPASRSPWASLNADGTPAGVWVSNVGTTCQNLVYYWDAPDVDK